MVLSAAVAGMRCRGLAGMTVYYGGQLPGVGDCLVGGCGRLIGGVANRGLSFTAGTVLLALRCRLRGHAGRDCLSASACRRTSRA